MTQENRCKPNGELKATEKHKGTKPSITKSKFFAILDKASQPVKPKAIPNNEK